jgi:hypothetical protein
MPRAVQAGVVGWNQRWLDDDRSVASGVGRREPVSTNVTMSRTEKLYERLHDVEIEYLRLLKAELQKVVGGGESWYLMIGRGYGRTKTHRMAEDQQIQSLHTELRRLREKLSEPTPALYKEVEAFVERSAVLLHPEHLWYPPDERTAIARKILANLDQYLEAIL